MATRMGAPGVRIELHDRSGYSLVESPNAIGGVVGFAPKGELNKIRLLTNTAQQDTYFGLGFNNSRYNQGMYAARAVINAGGHVEFVRPYGEEIDKTDDFKRDLKTDTFVVTYDRNAVNNKENADKTSIKVDYFASTRYKTDGAAKFGVTRKINNIAETIVNNSNVNFNVDASDDVFNVKKNFVSNGGSARGETDMVMFALMNTDPSGANRAFTSFEVDTSMTDDKKSASGELTVTLKGKVGFAVDDIVYGPVGKTTTELSTFRVTNIVDKTVSLKAEDEVTGKNVKSLGYRPEFLLYHDEANVTADGYDYLTVKTAVAGQGAKTFSSLHLDEEGLAKLKEIPSGSAMVFRDQDSMDVYVRVATPAGTDTKTVNRDGDIVTITVVSPGAIWVGDTVILEWGDNKSAQFKVTGVSDSDEFTLAYAGEGTIDSSLESGIEAVVKNTQSATWVDSVDTPVLTVTSESTVADVVGDLVAILRGEELAYGYANVLGDIAKKDKKLLISEDKKTVTLTPGGALEFVTDDLVAITRASVDLEVESGDAGLSEDNIVWFGKVKKSDPITDTVEFYDEIASAVLPTEETELNFQLLNLTQTNKVVYAATDSVKHPETMTAADAEFGPLTQVTSGSSYAAPVYTITGVSGQLSGSATPDLSVVVTYDGKTATGSVGTDGVSFTATFDAAFTLEGTRSAGSDVPPECSGLTITVSGSSESASSAAFDYSGNTPGADEVLPVYAVKSITVTTDSVPACTKVGDTVTFTYDDRAFTGTVSAVGDTGVTVIADVVGNDQFTVEGTREGDSDVPPSADASKVADLTVTVTKGFADIYVIGNYTVMVPVNVQNTTSPVALDKVFVDTAVGSAFKYLTWSESGDSKLVVDRSDKVLTDSSIGATFVGLGLANIRYTDVNFTGNTVKVYDLTDEGEAVARLYLSVAYMYNGILYEFDGTVVKYVYNDMQLFIGDAAEIELEGSGVVFVLNDTGAMEMFREDNSYDLSSTVAGEVQADGSIKPIPSSTTLSPAFNTEDPAIVHNAVWTYDPSKNMSTSTISNAFNLFLNKDKSDVTFFVGAGLGLNNFGLKGYETLNTQVMQAILSICELRKDCFALFDGVADSRINTVLKLDSPASRFGSTLGRWGAIYDARPIFYDSIVTKSNVELAPSIAMASLITANRKASVFWHVPAGEDTGMIPGAWCRKLKYERTFTYPEDPDSDIAKLCDIHVNPFRSNKKGIYCYGDFTMQMEDTAFNAINVTMLVAQIHKMFYNYLDSRVYRLNTTALRAQISGDLQLKLDQIVTDNPAGLELGSKVICDDTNNTPEVIEAHKLYVDLMLYPTSSTRYIYLRTNVLSRTTGNVITTDISTGAR